MCWSASVSSAMVVAGAAATIYVARRGQPRAIWLTLGYFTVMEALQAAGYYVVNNCGSPANQVVALGHQIGELVRSASKDGDPHLGDCAGHLCVVVRASFIAEC